MDVRPFFEWCEATAIGTTIRDSSWMFGVIEAVHLLALSVIGGAVLLVDLRLLGLGLYHQPVRDLSRGAQPWLNGSLVVMIITGVLLFLSESIKCYYSGPFWFKMGSLLLAVVFTYTVRRKVVLADEGRIGPMSAWSVGIVSLALWLGVGAAGRWIGFAG